MEDKFVVNEVIFTTNTGKVLSSSEKRVIVEGEGGGGFISNGEGLIDNVKINSKIDHEIWIETENCKELSYQINNSDIPLRKGQSVSIVECFKNGSNNRILIGIINHTSNQSRILNGVLEIEKRLKITSRSAGVYFIINMFILFIFMLFLLSYSIGGVESEFTKNILFFIYIIVYAAVFVIYASKVKKVLINDDILRSKLRTYFDKTFK